MTASRDEWLPRLRDVFHGRPVRWGAVEHTVGDYDGRERTLEVFNADAREQRPLLTSLRSVRAELEAVIGGPVVVIFHTTAESARLHADFVRAVFRQEALDDSAAGEQALPVNLDELTAALALEDLPLKARQDGNEGARILPREAA